MSRQALKAMAELRHRQELENAPANLWPELCPRIDDGQVIPIISNAISGDLIFASLLEPDADESDPAEEPNPLGWNAEDVIADAWAEEVGFPLPDQHWLPRVALYVRVAKSKTVREAKNRYLNFLKDTLLFLAEKDGRAKPATLQNLLKERERYKFSDVVEELGYLQSGEEETTPLDLLARLNLPIYLTTSHFDFLERAIVANGRKPRTQVCFWSGEPAIFEDELHKTDHNFEPSVECPLVYHIFGIENYVDSMVLNEDDYLDFLGTLARDAGSTNPVMPAYLQEAIAKSSLLMLGYRLRDMEFRVMFRGLIRPSSLRDFNVAIQMDLRQQSDRASPKQIMDYLEKYLGSSKFTVSWDTPQVFMTTLWDEMQKWRR